MSHRTTFVYTRPNTSVEWYVQPESYTNLFITELIDTGKVVFTEPVFSPDGLTKTHQATWLDDNDRIEWIARETSQEEIANRIAYCSENGITLDILYDDV